MQEMDKIVENPEESPIFHLSNVLHYPNVTPAAQIQILKLLRESLDMSITAQMFFKEINGLNALISLPLREIDSSFMNAWISTIISAIKGFKNYIDNDKFIKLSSQLPESYQTLFLGGYLAIALENTGFINLFHEFENVSSKELSQDFFDYIDDLVQSKMPRNRPYLVNPEILAVFPAYLDLILSKKGALECYPIVLVLYNITTSCTRNLSACHSGSFVLRLLEFSFKVLLRPDENLQLQALVGKYIRRLFDSETKTEYLRCLFSQLELLPQNSLTNRAIVTDLIQYALNRPRTPDFIHFEAENNPCHGYIKIDDYERPFPPQYGYSLVTWIKIDTIDPSHDVQIMTIIDAEDSVRLSLSFGAQSRQLSLQTMKSTVILESVTLEKNVWYHLALVHLKPMLSASTLKVFLNGKFADMVQCGYMGHPGGSSAVSTFFGSASQSGLRISGHSWNLGPTLFLEEILLEPKAISYMFQNSYEFQGNWQGVILDSKHLPPSTSDPVEESTGIIDPVSTITSIVFAAPSTISDIVGFKEDKILLSLHPGTETRRLTKEYAAEPLSTIKQVARSLTSSSKSLLCLTRPSLISSDTPQAGKTFGDLICCPTENIYNAVWRIGGPAIFLYLVETSTVFWILRRIIDT